ncbi:sulfate/molybdate ABC transporter ATP-binding protein [Sphingomonas jaspsi]|uniref:sulfate/molybdate ABC transporter ATP-binding protein n=1 Tax=Sphingomonas jaspsi TaxID=392409 RepID=UPI0004B938AD|nr:sulfate ABC transporter ATP-binding protein [Sphingomonas jaspsi]
MIRLANISKSFDRQPALHDVSLDIEPGEFVALLGPSGSGKTTLLRIIAGLDRQDSGAVYFDGNDVSDLSIANRRIGLVFQNYALFQHMKVADNIAFGLNVLPRSKRPKRPEIAKRVADLLKFVQLDGLGGRYPAQLSGGQRQRVALARALAINPQLLLLDEPFGALDAQVRKDLRRWLRKVHDDTGITTVFVTHDQEEAMEMADRVAVLSHGRLEQFATPETIYAQPASAFVSKFVGETNIVRDGTTALHMRPHELVEAANGRWAVRVTEAFQRGGVWRVEGLLADGDGQTLMEIDLPLTRARPDAGSIVKVDPIDFRTFPLGEPA